MDFSGYSDSTVSMAVDLVNTLDIVDGTDSLNNQQAVATFIAEHDGEYDATTDHPKDDLLVLIDLRTRLRTVFESKSIEAAAAILNRILAEMPATPRISTHADAPHLHFEPLGDGAVARLGATAAMALAIVLVDEGTNRFGICESSGCVDVYVDTSKNRSRRFCSETCSTRESVAAYRKRQRSEVET